MGLSINKASMLRQITTIKKKHQKEVNKANYRTLNIVQKRGQTWLARDIRDDTGHTISTTKKSVKAKRASIRNQQVKWFISGRRLQYPGVRVVKRKKRPAGISYLGRGKKRIVMLDHIGTGSKPFVIKGQHSSKKIAVFRPAGNKRKVQSYAGHSIPYLTRFDWEKKLRRRMKLEMVKEFPKQLERAKFR
jgi:hypothetical protein